ncbi:hypothetical protein [Streptomyces scopuliridis]|uniref:hypothetical protein n=1 Tax=Streptomyces scopuliridis TaxID=452529 RepID=UPI00342E2DAE
MSDMLSTVGLAGALLCLAGRLPGSVHRWGPHFAALSGMSLMAAGLVVAGAWVTAFGCLWSAARVSAGHQEWSEVIDLGAMMLLMALMALGTSVAAAHHHASAVPGEPGVGPAALVLVLWVTARAGAVMFRSLRTGSRDSVARRPSANRARACSHLGGMVMILSMTAMFA